MIRQDDSRFIYSSDILLEISKGNISDHYTVDKFSRNIEIDSGVTADIWDGGYTIASGGTSLIWVAPTQARIHTIASSDINDTTGGTGANSIKIWYLPDWNTREKTETVTGNLNAGIAMTNPAVIINRMKVVKQSTQTSINVGQITATAATDGTITSIIRPGRGQTQQSIYGFPSIQTFYLYYIYAHANKSGGATGLCDLSLMFNDAPQTELTTFIDKHPFGLITAGSSSVGDSAEPPEKYQGPGILKIQALSGSNDMDISAGFNGVLVDN